MIALASPDTLSRHCVWNCLMAQSIPVSDAKEIADNHEDAGNRGNQPSCEDTMDRSNNETGRNLANKGDCASSCLKNILDRGLTWLK